MNNMCVELAQWLEQIDMQKYLTNFLKQLVFKDVLVLYNDQSLVDLGITLTGDRLRLVSLALLQFLTFNQIKASY
jgi:hypothetical protein